MWMGPFEASRIYRLHVLLLVVGGSFCTETEKEVNAEMKSIVICIGFMNLLYDFFRINIAVCFLCYGFP